MGTPRPPGGPTWPYGGLKAFSTLSLGFYNNKSSSTFSLFNRAEPVQQLSHFEHLKVPENVRYNPEQEHLIDSLKVVMMNLRHNQAIPVHHNGTVNILIELYETAVRDLKLKKQQMKKAEKEAEALENKLDEKEAAWDLLERAYRQEIKQLELIVARGKGGQDVVKIVRSNTKVTQRKEEFRKTTSNLSTFRASRKADKDHDKHQDTAKTAAADQERKSQVFEHKRVSIMPTDKFTADFGTRLDKQLSRSIQHHEDRVAGDARRKWFAAGHTNYSMSSDGSTGKEGSGLGISLYDKPLVPQDSVKAPPPPRLLVETDTGEQEEPLDDDAEDEDGGNGGGDLIAIEGGGFILKPKKRPGAGRRAKAFFGLGKRKPSKLAQEQVDDSSSSSSSSSDDESGDDRHHTLARGLAGVTAFATGIAGPVSKMERAKSPVPAGLHPGNLFTRLAKKSSHLNIHGVAHHSTKATKKEGYEKSLGPKPIQHPHLQDTFKSIRNRPPTPFASRSTSNLRYEYDPDKTSDTSHGTMGSYGSTDNLRLQHAQHARDEDEDNAAISLSSRIFGKERVASTDLFSPYGSSTNISRVYDPRLPRKPTPTPMENTRSHSGESGSQVTPPYGPTAAIGRVKSQKEEERDAVEAASRRLLMRASGHKNIDDNKARWGQMIQDSPPPFGPLETSAAAGADGKSRPISTASVVTVVRRPVESFHGSAAFVFPPRDSRLIQARSSRAGAGQGNEPFVPSPEMIQSAASRDARNQVARQVSSASTTTARKHRESIRGYQDFLSSLRGKIQTMPDLSKVAENDGGLRTWNSTSKGDMSRPDGTTERTAETQSPISIVPNRKDSESDDEGRHTPTSSDDSMIFVHKTRDPMKTASDSSSLSVTQTEQQSAVLDQGEKEQNSDGSSRPPASRPITAIYSPQVPSNAPSSPNAPEITPPASDNACSVSTASTSSITRQKTVKHRPTSRPIRTREAQGQREVSRDREGAPQSSIAPASGASMQGSRDRAIPAVPSGVNIRGPAGNDGYTAEVLQLERPREEVGMPRVGGSGQSRGGDRVLSTSSVSSLRDATEADVQTQNGRRPQAPGPRNISGGTGTGHAGGSRHHRTPGGNVLRGNMGQRQASGEASVPNGFALAAARRVVGDEARRKEAEKGGGVGR